MTDQNEPTAKRPRKMARDPKVETAMVSEPLALTTNPKPQGKGAMVEQMLSASDGITLGELCEATGWLPHTGRAFLTGLRKRGRAVERVIGEDGKSLYRILCEKAAA